jgi:citrate synthase
VANLLWLGKATNGAAALAGGIQAGRDAFRDDQAWLKLLPGATPVETFQAVLPLAAARDVAAYDLRTGAVALTGARILGLLAAAATYPAAPAAGRMAERLWQGWRRKVGSRRQEDRAARLIDAALILSADHELNTSAFTARCVASVRATPYQVVMAALAALRGARHGGHIERVEALCDETGSPARACAAFGAWLKRGDGLPGFGHPLYSEGDPRARALLDMAGALAPRSGDLALARAICQAVEKVTGEQPTIDFGLVVAARVLGLPRGAALALFALGRTAGWIAHAIEQYQVEAMIRPRARYVGALPSE